METIKLYGWIIPTAITAWIWRDQFSMTNIENAALILLVIPVAILYFWISKEVKKESNE